MSLTLRGKMKTIAWRWRASHHWFSGRRDFTDSHLWLVLYAVSIASSSKTFIRWSFNNIRFKLSLTMISSCENTLGISLRWIYRCWTSFRRGCRIGVEFPIIDAQSHGLHTHARTMTFVCLLHQSVCYSVKCWREPFLGNSSTVPSSFCSVTMQAYRLLDSHSKMRGNVARKRKEKTPSFWQPKWAYIKAEIYAGRKERSLL